MSRPNHLGIHAITGNTTHDAHKKNKHQKCSEMFTNDKITENFAMRYEYCLFI